MAAKFGVPVCPHAGGVGLCEHVQHLSMFDFIAVTGTMEHRVIEFVDHLHEHFVDPVRIERGATCRRSRPGYSTEIRTSRRKRTRIRNGRMLGVKSTKVAERHEGRLESDCAALVARRSAGTADACSAPTLRSVRHRLQAASS